MYHSTFEWTIFDEAGNLNSSILVQAASKDAPIIKKTAAAKTAPAKPLRLPSDLTTSDGCDGDVVSDSSAANVLSQGGEICCGWSCGGNGQRKWREKENWVADILPLELRSALGGDEASEKEVTIDGLTKPGVVDLDAITSNLGVYELAVSSTLWGEVFRYLAGGADTKAGKALGSYAGFSLLESLWNSATSAVPPGDDDAKAANNATGKESKTRTIFSLLQPKYFLPPQLPAHAGRKTLILDLDETLIHSFFSKMEETDAQFYVDIFGQMTDVSVLKRPGTDAFLEAVAEKYEVVVFTASIPNYANAIIDWLDPEGRLIHHRLYRDSCTWWRGGYVKDLAKVGRDLKNTILVDNSPHSFAFQTKNGVCVTSYIDEEEDEELTALTEPLLKLAEQDGDVRDWLWTCYAEEE
ncbi:hypothetical protein CLOM_g1570 [Closterium sp. NIES-68]|nr:hypothetical protein CLOM_g1570 [Closterium sp. NIES-68]GJP85971.1 hypothetical protein CLOP_g16053 [Closterium sp. NIES-67]